MEKMILAITNTSGKREFNSLKKQFVNDGWVYFGNNSFIKFLAIQTDENIYLKKIENYKFSKSITTININKDTYKTIQQKFSKVNKCQK